MNVRRNLLVGLLLLLTACARSQPPPTAPPPASTPAVPPPPRTQASYHASLGRGAELYLPPWFEPKNGGYDLLVHFHGEGRLQAANIEHAKLNVAVVSVNHSGFGTEPYASAFKQPDAFNRLLDDTEKEIAKSHRADGAHVRRIALSAWSAGFSSIAKVMNGDVAARVDAVLLADGFFTNFTDVKKRTVNEQALEKFVRFAEAARRGEKLFAITHTTIPTGPYPSVQECVAKLLELLSLQKSPSSSIGPHNMHAIYVVDEGGLHIHGFEGTRASDHVRQLQAMGETIYPYLRERWGD